MIRTLAMLALAPAAIGIRHDRDANTVALAGPDVLVMSESPTRAGGVKVVAVPRTGGPARTLLKVANAGLANNQLAASAQRVAVVTEINATKTSPDEHRVYSGPPSGPLTLVRRTLDPNGDARIPGDISVDGNRLLLVEGIEMATTEDDPPPAPVRASILDASGWTPIPWASGERRPVAIAGPYAAVVVSDPKQVEVVELATGRTVATIAGQLNYGEYGGRPYDLLPDGQLVVGMTSGIETAGPGLAHRNLPNSGRLIFPRFAGSSFVAFDDVHDTLNLFGPDGAQTALGPPSRIRTAVDGDADGVAWLFNGCVRYAPLSAPGAATAKDPCPTAEVSLFGPSTKLRGNAVRLGVQCVAAAGGRCRGRLVVRLDYGKPIVARGTFDVPVAPGHYRYVKVHFNAATVAKFHRDGWGSAIFNAIVEDGTVGSGADYSAEVQVDVDKHS